MAPEWLYQHEPGDDIMSLRDRVHELRKERGWSQAELASRIGADAGQISRYENGRITPSADAIVRLAEAFDVTTDYLLVETAPRRPLHAPEDALGDKLADLASLNDNERALVLGVIDAITTKAKLRAITSTAS
jgi:transcriptional regulator with XRE-family HTH domain